MSTVFYRKSVFVVLLSAFVFTVSCLFYARSFQNAHTVDVGADFYLLTSLDEDASVGVEYTKLDGGAGYFLKYGGQEYAVWSLYFDEETGETVQSRLESSGKKTRLVHVGTDTVCFRTLREKQQEKPTVELLNIVKGCMQVLGETVSRLEKGMTQEKAKTILTLLSKQLNFCGREYASNVSGLASVCTESAQRLDTMAGDTVYSDKLMYELCFLADGYLSSCSQFAL